MKDHAEDLILTFDIHCMYFCQTIDIIDYVTRIGNSSHAPIVIVYFAMAHNKL